MEVRKFIQRFFVPPPLVSIYYFMKFRCKISHRAEVEMSRNLKIGKGSQISSFTKIKATVGPVTIGENVDIGPGCFISSHESGIDIGNDCLIGPNVNIVAGNYQFDRLDIPIRKQGSSSKGIRIGNDVWLGAGACVLDGAEIGDGVIVSANSVVSTKISNFSVVIGNPAKAIFKRSNI